jgi:hypothetical protein
MRKESGGRGWGGMRKESGYVEANVVNVEAHMGERGRARARKRHSHSL